MPRTNGETLLWHQEGLLYGRVSEEKFKSEAIKFFGLTQEESCKSKQYFKKDIQDFINKHVNLQKNILREYLEENGGIGKHHETFLYGNMRTPVHSFPSRNDRTDPGMTKKSFLGHSTRNEAGMEGFPSLSFQHQFSHSNVILI